MTLKLSKRLKAIADMIPECDSFTDIGCDHGYLPVYLLLEGRCLKAVASDIGEGPLDTARANAAEYGLGEERISFILSDGLSGIPDPGKGFHILNIAGMGGLNIAGILESGRLKASSYDCLYLSPHTKTEELRRFLVSEGYRIEAERYLVDEGKLYVIMKVLRGVSEAYSEKEYLLGAFAEDAVADPEVREAFMHKLEEYEGLLADPRLPSDRRELITGKKNIYREVLKL